MLKLKLYFGHLMWRADSLGKTLMVGTIEGERRRGRQRMRWLDGLTDGYDLMDMSFSKLWEWPEEPGGLQSMGSRRVGHDWATTLSLFTLMNWRRKWQPTPVFLPGESQGWGSLVGYEVAQSWTRLKRLSGSSSREDWHAAVHGSQSRTWLSDWTELNFPFFLHIDASLSCLLAPVSLIF